MLRHRLVAHRGYPRKYPENTLLGIEQAVVAGAAFVEIDIQFTRDLEPVIYHDQSLVRVSGTAGYVNDMDAAEVLTLPASEPFRLGETFGQITISHLRELAVYLRSQPQLTVFVELKKDAIAFAGYEKTYDAIADILNDLASQIVLISFDVEYIAFCRAQGWGRLGVVLSNWSQLEEATINEIDPDYVFADVEDLPPNADFSHIKPLLVVYEIGSAQDAMGLFNSGVDMVETFDIGGMISELGCHNI